MRGADPDALWRPGFTGSWGYTARVLPRTRRRRPLAVGAGVALLAAAATAAVGLADRGADGSGGFPTGAAHRWSVELAGLEVGRVTRGDDMVVLADTHGSRVVALGARDGTPRWEGRLPKGFVADLQVTEPAVLAVVRERVGSEVLVALDAVDGSPRWSEELAGARVVTVGSSGIILERMARETRGLELLDADTRLVAVAGLSGTIVAFPPRLLDASTGETRWDGPAEVLGASARRVFADGGFIGLIGARGQDQMVVGYDLEGVERWRRPLDNGERAVLVDGGLVTVTNRSEGATVSLSS